LPATAQADEVSDIIVRLNNDRRCHGIILQLPLPRHLPGEALIEMIDPEKDVDGLTPTNLGRLMAGRPGFVPATPAGIVELLVRYSIPIAGRRVVIVGRGELVGKPLANLLLLRGERGDATVTVCHTQTKDLSRFCLDAEILIVAAGRPGLITGAMVSSGVVVIDAGINRTENGIVGDVDFESVAAKARAISPVPGGVGPMTVAMLLANTVQAAKRNS
jgi:methylenetetrahydrofolate dehydrogenase (NADP+)/methenyltetrahydrofolate cyclohydrolase